MQASMKIPGINDYNTPVIFLPVIVVLIFYIVGLLGGSSKSLELHCKGPGPARC